MTRFLELGPDAVLTPMVRECLDGRPVTVVPALRRDHGEVRTLLDAVGGLWAAGVAVDWTALLPAGNRVDLPTYAFHHQRYWLPVAPKRADTAEDGFWDLVEHGDLDALATALDIDEQGRASLGTVLPALTSWRGQRRTAEQTSQWQYQVGWRPVTQRTDATLNGRWLVLVPAEGDVPGWSAAVAKALGARGAAARELTVPRDHYDQSALAALLAEEFADGVEPGGVLSLLAFDEEAHPQWPAVPAGQLGTLALVQAIGNLVQPVPLWCVTSGTVAVAPEERTERVAAAAVQGFGRTAGLEHPDYWGGVVDMPAWADDEALDRLAGVLAEGGEPETAVRPGQVHARRLLRTPAAPATPWQPGGAALITGGTGALGAEVARWLAGNGVRHLVLTSRRGPGAPGAEELSAELTALGATVSVVACDVADRGQLASLLCSWPAEEPLTAVFHTAGVLDDGIIGSLTPDRFERVFRAKTLGALHLDELTRDLAPDTFVLFSSISGVLGTAGQSNYAAANSWLDALAERRRGEGLPAVSIAWGPWAGAGMAHEDGVGQRLSAQGLEPMPTHPALSALLHVLGRGDATAVVADVRWERIAAQFPPRSATLLRNVPEFRAGTAESPAADPHEGPALRERLVGLSAPERGHTVTELIRAQVAKVLGHADPKAVKATQTFQEIGFDSLAALQLRNRLCAATGLALPGTLAFDHPTTAAVASYVLAELFPDDEAGRDGGNDAEIRAALAAITPEQLRQAGLVDSLLGLARSHAQDFAAPERQPGVSIDEMDVADLVRAAYDKH
ncbi:hypothetical protein BIV25_44125 [Streptomyces sp. MUSC 14]|nr:hypothetical protein BIV25_44125 [Streptomyces sp. MUSC 14]